MHPCHFCLILMLDTPEVGSEPQKKWNKTEAQVLRIHRNGLNMLPVLYDIRYEDSAGARRKYVAANELGYNRISGSYIWRTPYIQDNAQYEACSGKCSADWSELLTSQGAKDWISLPFRVLDVFGELFFLSLADFGSSTLLKCTRKLWRQCMTCLRFDYKGV